VKPRQNVASADIRSGFEKSSISNAVLGGMGDSLDLRLRTVPMDGSRYRDDAHGTVKDNTTKANGTRYLIC